MYDMAKTTSVFFLSLFFATCSSQIIAFNPTITPVPGQPFALTSASGPITVAYSPDLKWLATANTSSSSLSVFKVNNVDGSLTEIAGSPFSSLNLLQATSVCYSPDSKFLAAASFGANVTTIFMVDPETGALSNPISYDDGVVEGGPYQLLYSPNGQFLAVLNNNFGGSISVFQVDQTTGTLMLPPNTTSLTGGIGFGGSTQIATYSPDGNFFACAYQNNSQPGGVIIFSVDQATGTVSNQNMIPVNNAVNGMNSVAYSPDGSLLAAADNNSSIYMFSVNENTGEILLISTTTTPAGNFDPQFGAFSPDGQFFVAGDSITNSLYVYTVNTQTATLTPFGSPLATGTFPNGMLTFSPITAEGNSFCSTSNTTSSDITSYQFSLCPAIGDITLTTPAAANIAPGATTTISGTLSIDGNTVIVTSSDPSVISILNTTVNGTQWSAQLKAHSPGSAVITAAPGNCSLFTGQSVTALYTVLTTCTNNNRFSCSLFSAIQNKYFLGK